MHLGGRPARVERPAHGRLGEAVDRRAAAGLDVGHRGQVRRELLLERAGGDGGQVGLHQHVVDGGGEQRVQGRGDLAGRVGGGARPRQQRPPRRREPAERGHAEHRRLLDRPGDGLGAQRGPAGPQPADPLDQGRHAGAGREHRPLGPRAPISCSVVRRVSASQPRSRSGTSALTGLPAIARADQARSRAATRARPARAASSAAASGEALPEVEGVGRAARRRRRRRWRRWRAGPRRARARRAGRQCARRSAAARRWP